MRRGNERKISGAISRLAAEIAPTDPLAQIAAQWPSVVGDAISRESKPESISASTLTISCSSSVWAQELELLSRSIIKSLGEQLPQVPIDKLRCVVTGNPAKRG